MYRFIENIGDFFTPGYYTEDFISKVISLSGYDQDAIKEFNSRFSRLKAEYFDFKSKVKDLRLHRKYVIRETHDFNTKVMAALGYDTTPAYANWVWVDETSVIPARSILKQGSKTRLAVLEMQAMVKAHEDDVPAGLFEQQYDDQSEKVVREQNYNYKHWSEVISKELPEGCKISPSKINDCVTALFRLDGDERPQYVIIFAGNVIFLLEQDKWDHGAYVKFDLEELFSEASISANRNYYALFYLLASKEVLAGDAQIVLMDKIAEESFKNTYEVTKDLKKGVIKAVELLANEAIHYKKNIQGLEFDETDDSFASDVKDDCLTIIYRLLFIFYAEARPEIGILPMDDPTYAKGYSLDILRELEQTPLRSDQSQNSYFFNDSLWTLFRLICNGHKDITSNTFTSFSVKKIDSPLFDDSKLKQLRGVKFRNIVWQEIICSLSLSEEQSRKSRGRISYANLGVNQLGSVYESLLAYRGFYAEEDYIEVHPVGDTVETYLVPRSRMGDFKSEEILRDSHDNVVTLKKGKFVYRLNGRDRKKSASYYTPEVLTKSTVKYTLKGFVEKLDSGEMKAEDLLKLKILEPAMGAAAFQNEVINQVAELYLSYRQKERGQHISPHQYRDELQKVKAYIATKNIYGVDLNPTAIELGKLSLWLNVIHKDMETPFFGHRIALGNAVIGAWFKAYDEDELCKIKSRKYISTEWWTKAPHLLHFSKETKKLKRRPGEIYHFLVPDKNMLAALNIKEEKAAHPTEATRMKQKISDWTKPITKEDMQILRRLSAKIDSLIKECVLHQQKVDYLTQNRYAIWGHTDRSYDNYIIDSFNDKQSVADSRNQKGNAFYRLRTVMDYWCSLWFWEYNDASLIPTREDYWLDIAQILGVDLSSRTEPVQTEVFEENSLFSELETDSASENSAEETIEEDIPTFTKEDAEAELRKVRSETQLFDNGFRIPVVQRLANRYHFFHPMLEFIEVFWLRDGFDVICGNPPWLMSGFNILEVFSDKFPEVILHGFKAPDVKKDKELYFSKSSSLKELYEDELLASTCTSVFSTAHSTYPLLDGVQSDLFMCILETALDMLSNNGFMGMVHPEAIYNTAKLSRFREQVYHRLVYHFQYYNELLLFAEVHHEKPYGVNIYGGFKKDVSFISISNLYHPSTIDGCLAHNGLGTCFGKKVNGKWNVLSHKDRVVHYDDDTLQLIGSTFEAENNPDGAPMLVNIHNQAAIEIIRHLSSIPSHVNNLESVITTGFHETGAVDEGTICRRTFQPCDDDEIILNGPHIGTANPLYKMPRTEVENNSSYDVIDLTKVTPDFKPTTCFASCIDHHSFRDKSPGFILYKDENGKEIYDCWLDYYRLAISEWVGPDAERTLSGAIIPPNMHHIGTIVSVAFKDYCDTVELAGLISSLPLDYYIKLTGTKHIKQYRINSFPIHIDRKYRSALIIRTLLLNCVTEKYKQLYTQLWDDSYLADNWSIDDSRLTNFNSLSKQWLPDTPLRTYFARRQALVEIDVIASIALGISLDDLIMMFTTLFSVMQQYDSDTWFDAHGSIIFTSNSQGLKGVGLDRKIWEQIRGEVSEDGMTYAGTSETYEHTIDPAKSELYGGQKVTYYAPYNRCDRIEDYRRAWAHFEKVFNEEKN